MTKADLVEKVAETGKGVDGVAWEAMMAGVFYKMELEGKDKK